MDLAQAREWHLSQLSLKRRAATTAKLYGLYEQVFLDYLEAVGLGYSLDMLNVENVEDCVRWMRTHRRGGTRGNAVAERTFVQTWRRLAKALWRRKVYSEDPLARLETPAVRKIHKRPFTEDDVRRLFMAVSFTEYAARNRVILLMLLDTGCRVGELCAATIDDLDLDQGQIIFRVTKAGTPRVVSFKVPGRRNGGRTLAALKEYLRIRQAQPGVLNIFTTHDGYPLTARGVAAMHKQIGARARVTPCTPHLWRHTSITEVMAEMPGAREALAARVGHTKLLSDYVSITERQSTKVAEIASLSERWEL